MGDGARGASTPRRRIATETQRMNVRGRGSLMPLMSGGCSRDLRASSRDTTSRHARGRTVGGIHASQRRVAAVAAADTRSSPALTLARWLLRRRRARGAAHARSRRARSIACCRRRLLRARRRARRTRRYRLARHAVRVRSPMAPAVRRAGRWQSSRATDLTTGATYRHARAASAPCVYRFAADGSSVVDGTGRTSFAWYLPGDDSDLGAGPVPHQRPHHRVVRHRRHVREGDLQRHADRTSARRSATDRRAGNRNGPPDVRRAVASIADGDALAVRGGRLARRGRRVGRGAVLREQLAEAVAVAAAEPEPAAEACAARRS